MCYAVLLESNSEECIYQTQIQQEETLEVIALASIYNKQIMLPVRYKGKVKQNGTIVFFIFAEDRAV